MTMLAPDRVVVLQSLVREAVQFQGDLAELGVYEGGSARLIHDVSPNRRLHLFDTFTGLPDPDPSHGDIHPAGRFTCSAVDALSKLSGAPITLYVGRFPDSLSGMTPPSLCFVHVDADLYWSVFYALAIFWPRLVPGGIILVDDYGFDDCAGAKKAVDEFGGAEILETKQAVLRKAA